MKRHFELVKQRQKRVVKYGQLNETMAAQSLQKPGQSYAMFSGKKQFTNEDIHQTRSPGAASIASSELRRRAAPVTAVQKSASPYDSTNYKDGSSAGDEDSTLKSNAQKMRQKATNRLANAEQVETTIAKV